MDRHAAFDEVKYPNSWQILRKHKNLAGRPLKPGVKCSKNDPKMNELYGLLAEVEDEKTFLKFTQALQKDREKHESKQMDNSGYSGDWANSNISDYLESALAWAEDSNFGLSQDPELAKNKWKQFATFLYCGKIYE